jgi:glutathione S-transferase
MLKEQKEMLKTQGKPTGPYFMGENMCLAEVACMPFFARMVVLKRYTGFETPTKLKCLNEWTQEMKKRESYKQTTQTDEYYIEAYKAFGTATTPPAVR